MSKQILEDHQLIWQKKPILRKLYHNWYQEMSCWLQLGKTLELGGGSGNFKEYAPNVISTDIVPSPWIDIVADAQDLPFDSQSFDNLVLFDVLHHIENVTLFFNEALRVLRPSGRIIIMDPYISLLSWPVYHLLHPEPVDFQQNPLDYIEPSTNRKPFDANQAISTILFEKKFIDFQDKYPQFIKIHHRRLAFFAYPLSGGFDKPSLIPMACLEPVLRIEKTLSFLNYWLAFRILVVLEKRTV